MTTTIIIPIDKKRSLQLLALLRMFSGRAVIPLKDITAIIPKSTFFALVYKLRLLAMLVKERQGFDLFAFESSLDGNGRVFKSMRLNAAIEVAELDGGSFVVLTRKGCYSVAAGL